MAAPGVGKSQLWQNFAVRMKVPTLLWSADTAQEDVLYRCIAQSTSWTVEEAETKYNDPSWSEYIAQVLQKNCGHIEWVWDSPIAPKLAGERLNAFAEVHGQYPHLMVLDNLSNAVENTADEYAEIKQVMAAVQKLARETRTHIAVLHHAKGEFDSGTKPIPQSGALQNPFKLPEVGLTLYRPDENNKLAINIVKNRGGKADPAAKHPIILPVNFARATVQGFESERASA